MALASEPETLASRAALDPLQQLQHDAVIRSRDPLVHWGCDPNNSLQWSNHSNRLVPIYTFGTKGAGAGIDLESYAGANSAYRSEESLKRLYGLVPVNTLNAEAEYLDQTNVHDLQKAALAAGKKNIFLVVFDGMCWHATRAAAIAKTGRPYSEGRGNGLFLQDYDGGGTSQYGFMVTSPYCDKVRYDVDSQAVGLGERDGGYDAKLAGPYPWSKMTDSKYIICDGKAKFKHAYTDSAASATSMNSGIKTYNAGVNVSASGEQVEPLARVAQKLGYAVGSVTSVPIPHATPASTYANNVDRNDYQDLTRDLLGLPSISHPKEPLSGMDVVIGAGWGVNAAKAEKQGQNYVPGNLYLASADLRAIDRANGGQYQVSLRTRGQNGNDKLRADAAAAAKDKTRLLGFYGTRYEHLPYQTTDGDYRPTINGDGKQESYSKSDVAENPTLATMADAALLALSARSDRIWLMVEAGDVDFACHDNNIDNMIGSIYSGDDAVQTICRWVEKNSNWGESVLIVTADHGHYLVVEDPEKFATISRPKARRTAAK